MDSPLRSFLACTLSGLLLLPPPALLAQQSTTPADEEEEVIVLSPFEISASAGAGYAASTSFAGARLGATTGGAQDINFFRSGAGRGEVPHPNSITPEGLFSQHDLPLEMGSQDNRLFIVQTAAVSTRLPVLPEITHLAQLGFSSGIEADKWQRSPLNLVTVIDKSGSMNGQPLELVRQSLRQAVKHLHEGDQLSIVLYGNQCHVHLPPTPVTRGNKSKILDAITDIQSHGSTNMEAGLRLGYEVAAESARNFSGTSRVMLFTDERPNVGDTSAAGFMGMARHASKTGVGLTTIGVGVQFGVELANEISGVRGGNLFFFADHDEMRKTFAEDFDTMVTELAYDFVVRIKPARGFRLAGVFGLPANLLRWKGDAIEFKVESIFLSKRKGGIFFALAPDADDHNPYLPQSTPKSGSTLAHIEFSYDDATTQRREQSTAQTVLVPERHAQLGLTRGRLLVDEFLTLRQAASAHLFENDQETAWRLVHDLRSRLARNSDRSLDPERELVRNLHNTFAFLAGRTSEIDQDNESNAKSPLVGTWRSQSKNGDTQYLTVWPDGKTSAASVDSETGQLSRHYDLKITDQFTRQRSGKLTAQLKDAPDPVELEFAIRGTQLKLEFNTSPHHRESFRMHRATYAEFLTALHSKNTLNDEIEDGEWSAVDSLNGLPVRSR